MSKTKVATRCGALAFIICGLFPPWLYTHSCDYAARAETSAEFSFLLKAPEPRNRAYSYGIKLDTAKLAVEWLCVLAAAGAAWVLVDKPAQNETKR
jgi:hypothetical protein